VRDETALAHYRYDTVEAARVKFLLNVALPAADRRTVVAALFEREFADERATAGQLYADSDQIAELERISGAVGAHSYAHEPLTSLGPEGLERDLSLVTDVLEGITGRHPRAFSYPYGTAGTVDAAVADCVGAAGYEIAFTMQRGGNETLERPLLLARLDTNDVAATNRR
jgi:peptidoglycan/xylan/chitin deacetylase (PgdA/CDA1 family)